MGAKKIIIPIVIAAVVACGVGYYCYSTVKATNLSSSETVDTTSSSTTGIADASVSASTSKSASATNNETSVGSNSKVANTSIHTSSNNSKTTETTNTNNNVSSSNSTSSESTSSTSETSSKEKWVYAEGYVPSDYAYVSVRSEASSTSSVVTTLSTGAKFFVVSEHDDWAYIKTGSKGGYLPMWEISYTAPTSSTENSSSNSSSQTLGQLKQEYLNQINKINNTTNEINEKVKNENPTQYEIDEAEGNIYEIWQEEVNTIYSQLQKVLPSSEFSNLQQEQESWISTTNKEARSYAENYAGNGSDYSAVLAMKLGEYYKARCSYLVDNYM